MLNARKFPETNRLSLFEQVKTAETTYVDGTIAVAVDNGGLRVREVFFFGEDETLRCFHADAVQTMQLDLWRLQIVDETFGILPHQIARVVADVAEELPIIVDCVVARRPRYQYFVFRPESIGRHEKSRTYSCPFKSFFDSFSFCCCCYCYKSSKNLITSDMA